jgi:hypothetical protein
LGGQFGLLVHEYCIRTALSSQRLWATIGPMKSLYRPGHISDCGVSTHLPEAFIGSEKNVLRSPPGLGTNNKVPPRVNPNWFWLKGGAQARRVLVIQIV